MRKKGIQVPIEEGEQRLATELLGAQAALPHFHPQGIAGNELIERAAQFYVEVIETLATHVRRWGLGPTNVMQSGGIRARPEPAPGGSSDERDGQCREHRTQAC